jgi:formylglycine-generating enzyme
MRARSFLAAVLVIAVTNIASADTIRGINMAFVPIGHAGNAGDTRTGTDPYGNPLANPYGSGAVSYNYRIGKYEVTDNQWKTINTAAGIGESGDWYYNQPSAGMSWYEAAQFCNYLTSGNKYSGAYKFDISGNFQEIDRASSISTYGTTYVIPTEDEWYKAAYFKPDGSGYSLYANGTDTAPISGLNSNYNWVIDSPWNVGTGTMEQNGTFDMMGNVWEWNETALYGSTRVIRGGSYGDLDGSFCSSYQYYGSPDGEYVIFGFRVAEIPEPATLLLVGLGAAMLRRRG